MGEPNTADATELDAQLIADLCADFVRGGSTVAREAVVARARTSASDAALVARRLEQEIANRPDDTQGIVNGLLRLLAYVGDRGSIPLLLEIAKKQLPSASNEGYDFYRYRAAIDGLAGFADDARARATIHAALYDAEQWPIDEYSRDPAHRDFVMSLVRAADPESVYELLAPAAERMGRPPYHDELGSRVLHELDGITRAAQRPLDPRWLDVALLVLKSPAGAGGYAQNVITLANHAAPHPKKRERLMEVRSLSPRLLIGIASTKEPEALDVLVAEIENTDAFVASSACEGLRRFFPEHDSDRIMTIMRERLAKAVEAADVPSARAFAVSMRNTNDVSFALDLHTGIKRAKRKDMKDTLDYSLKALAPNFTPPAKTPAKKKAATKKNTLS